MRNNKFPYKMFNFSIVSLLTASTFLSPSLTSETHAETETSPSVVISEVYGGGGATSSAPAYKNDFIELYNPTDQSISLEGWSVQYASSAGSFNQMTSLTGTIAPNEYYLIKQSGGSLGKELPESHAEGSISLSASKGKAALVNNKEKITGLLDENTVDFVGYGDANEAETAPVPALDSMVSAQRKNPSIDSNHNELDFEVKAPTPSTSQGQPTEDPETPPTGLAIHDIQGASHQSPFAGQKVNDVKGIVTVVEQGKGFYLQELTPDNDTKTSEGIYVYQRNAQVNSGDIVLVSGTVSEYTPSSAKNTDLSTTQLTADQVKVETSGHPLPEPVALGEGEYILPTAVIDNDEFQTFDPAEDGIDFFESIEGMYVQVQKAKAVSPTTKYGEVIVAPLNQPTDMTKDGHLIIKPTDFNPERITIDDVLVDNPPVVKTGDTFNEPINGVIGYSFSGYKLYNTEVLPEAFDGGLEREMTSLAFSKDELTIASYNVENFSKADEATNPEKAEKLAEAVANNMKSPDIIGLVEMQDNDGPAISGQTDASESYKYLIEKIKQAGGPAYQFTDIAPADRQDGGQPGGNIRVGFLYNPDRVKLTNKPKGDAVTPAEVNKHGITLNPGRIAPNDPAFENSRKPLAAEFKFKGSRVTVIANHFNSKGGDQPLFGKNQPPFLKSEAQRLAIAQVVHDFTADLLAADSKANVVVLGDLNDFQFSNPLQALKGQSLVNMIDTLPFEEQYTYNYQGNSQVLDHVLVSNNLAAHTNADIIHLNADFTEQHGRASDHDPVQVQIDLKAARKTK